MTLNKLIENEASNKGAGLFMDIEHSFDGTSADVVVFDAEGSLVVQDTIADVEVAALKRDLCNAEIL